jgi:hypothetical protein
MNLLGRFMFAGAAPKAATSQHVNVKVTKHRRWTWRETLWTVLAIYCAGSLIALAVLALSARHAAEHAPAGLRVVRSEAVTSRSGDLICVTTYSDRTVSARTLTQGEPCR